MKSFESAHPIVVHDSAGIIIGRFSNYARAEDHRRKHRGKPLPYSPCPTCRGRGLVLVADATEMDARSLWHKCSPCGGSGVERSELPRSAVAK